MSDGRLARVQLKRTCSDNVETKMKSDGYGSATRCFEVLVGRVLPPPAATTVTWLRYHFVRESSSPDASPSPRDARGGFKPR